jgi:hypothetical protein
MPETTLTTPGGKPADSNTLPNSSSAADACSEAFAGRERRRDLDRDEEQLRIPGHDGRHHAQRFADGHRPHVRLVDRQGIAVYLVGEPGVVVVVIRQVRGLPAGFGEQFARVDRFGPAELLGMLLHRFREIAQQHAALGRQHRAPGPFRECTVCGTNGFVDVCLAGGRDRGPRLPGCRVQALERRAILGADPLAVDVHPVIFEFSHFAFP